MKTIRVTGIAQAALRPDVTVVTMTLQGTEPEYSAALSRASREAETLRDVLERLFRERAAGRGAHRARKRRSLSDAAALLHGQGP